MPGRNKTGLRCVCTHRSRKEVTVIMRRYLFKLARVAALATSAAFAQTPSANPQPGTSTTPPGPHHLGRVGRIVRALNLTESQKQQAKVIFRQARQTAQPVHQQLRQNRQMLLDAVKTSKTDAEIRQLSTEQGSLVGQIVAVRTEAWGKFYSLLTPEQRAQADQMW